MQTDDPENGLTREATWQGALTPAQAKRLESRLAAHPAERGAWEEEVALTRLLTRLPDAAAPSNLTARIMAAIDRDADRPRHVFGGVWLGWLKRLGWVPRLAGVAVLVMAGYLGHHQYQVSQRAELARSVASVTDLAGVVPSVDALMHLDVIRNLDSAGAPDEELLALYQ